MNRLNLIRAGLHGSPYSVDDSIAEEQIISLLDRSEGFESRCRIARATIAAELERSLKTVGRTTEIYESNRIEGKTATLEETYEILSAKQFLEADRAIASYTLSRSLTDETKVQDVVGLAAARVLVDQFLQDPQRPLNDP